MHLLDTPVVVALRDVRGTDSGAGLAAWAASVARESLFISAITLHELETRAQDRQAGAQWRVWIDDHVMRAFDGRVLAVDTAVVRRAGQIGRGDPRDGLIAATALQHRLTLATFRPRAFKASRVPVFDPTGFVPTTQVDDWRQAAQGAPTWIKSLFVRS